MKKMIRRGSRLSLSRRLRQLRCGSAIASTKSVIRSRSSYSYIAIDTFLSLMAIQRVNEDPDLAGHFEHRVITIEDYPSVGEMYERREQRRLKDPNGNDHLMGDLVREKLHRAFDPEVETLIKDRVRE